MAHLLSEHGGRLAEYYPTVIVGSGYGGAIVAARLAAAGEKVCVLERGKEWLPGQFPDTMRRFSAELRKDTNALGLYDYLTFSDVDVIEGCGLGGTSLINANVAFRPDIDLFSDARWPREIQADAETGALWRYYQRAEAMLRVAPHPRAMDLAKVRAIERRARQLNDADFAPVNVAVNFDVDGLNHVGVEQKPCIDCGDCITGCNVAAKNTLYTNYLPFAKRHGARIFTQTEVDHVSKTTEGRYRIGYRVHDPHATGAMRYLLAERVVVSAGSIGSTAILLRSRALGLDVSDALGSRFGGNGDFFGLAYNCEDITDVMGFGNHLESPRAGVRPGPTIVSAIRYERSKSAAQRFTIEDLAFPSGWVDLSRLAFPKLALLSGEDTDFGLVDKSEEMARIGRDLIGWNLDGALNRSMLYLVMADEGESGRIELRDGGQPEVVWPGVSQRAVFRRLNDELRAHTNTLGGTFVPNFRWTFGGGRNLITAHPLGGCPLGQNATTAVTDSRCRVFKSNNDVHEGLYVVDGAVIPMPLGVNPLLTISAISERATGLMLRVGSPV